MHNYFAIKRWHGDYDVRIPADSLVSTDDGASSRETMSSEITFNRNYVKHKLENGLVRIWRVSHMTTT